MTSPDLSACLANRDKLIKQDRVLRVDAVRLDNLSTTEAKAEEIVRALRAEEAISVWGAEHENIEHPFPGMEFLTSRSVILRIRCSISRIRCASVIFTRPSGFSEWTCVKDAKGCFAPCPLGRYRRRELPIEQDP